MKDSPSQTEVSFCEHHVRRNTPLGCVWNGPVARCGCCGSDFGYVDQGSIGVDANGAMVSSGRSWFPKDRCGSCGGKYFAY